MLYEVRLEKINKEGDKKEKLIIFVYTETFGDAERKAIAYSNGGEIKGIKIVKYQFSKDVCNLELGEKDAFYKITITNMPIDDKEKPQKEIGLFIATSLEEANKVALNSIKKEDSEVISLLKTEKIDACYLIV